MTEIDVRPGAGVGGLPPPGAALSHWSAARALRLPCPPMPRRHVTVRPGTLRPRRSGLVVHARSLPASDLVDVAGVRVTSAERTFLDLAERVGLPDLVAVGDAALRLELLTGESLAARIAAAPRRRGVVLARCALPLLDAAARCAAESVLRVRLIRSGRPIPVAGGLVGDRSGRIVGRCSLGYAAERVALDYVSDRRSPPQGDAGPADPRPASVVDRHTAMAAAGWLVLPFTDASLHDGARVLLARLDAALRERRPPAHSIQNGKDPPSSAFGRCAYAVARLPWLHRSPSPTSGRTSE